MKKSSRGEVKQHGVPRFLAWMKKIVRAVEGERYSERQTRHGRRRPRARTTKMDNTDTSERRNHRRRKHRRHRHKTVPSHKVDNSARERYTDQAEQKLTGLTDDYWVGRGQARFIESKPATQGRCAVQGSDAERIDTCASAFSRLDLERTFHEKEQNAKRNIPRPPPVIHVCSSQTESLNGYGLASEYATKSKVDPCSTQLPNYSSKQRWDDALAILGDHERSLTQQRKHFTSCSSDLSQWTDVTAPITETPSRPISGTAELDHRPIRQRVVAQLVVSPISPLAHDSAGCENILDSPISMESPRAGSQRRGRSYSQHSDQSKYSWYQDTDLSIGYRISRPFSIIPARIADSLKPKARISRLGSWNVEPYLVQQTTSTRPSYHAAQFEADSSHQRSDRRMSEVIQHNHDGHSRPTVAGTKTFASSRAFCQETRMPQRNSWDSLFRGLYEGKTDNVRTRSRLASEPFAIGDKREREQQAREAKESRRIAREREKTMLLLQGRY